MFEFILYCSLIKEIIATRKNRYGQTYGRTDPNYRRGFKKYYKNICFPYILLQVISNYDTENLPFLFNIFEKIVNQAYILTYDTIIKKYTEM